MDDTKTMAALKTAEFLPWVQIRVTAANLERLDVYIRRTRVIPTGSSCTYVGSSTRHTKSGYKTRGVLVRRQEPGKRP